MSTLPVSGALPMAHLPSPSPISNTEPRLRAMVALMRELGVTRYRSPSGEELTLRAEPQSKQAAPINPFEPIGPGSKIELPDREELAKQLEVLSKDYLDYVKNGASRNNDAGSHKFFEQQKQALEEFEAERKRQEEALLYAASEGYQKKAAT